MDMLKSRFDEYAGYLIYSSKVLRRRWIIACVSIAVTTVLTGLITRNIGISLFVPLVSGLTCYIGPVGRYFRPLWATGEAMRRFATSNGLRYIEISKPNYQKHFQPAVARLGLFERHEQIVMGVYEGYKFRTYVDTYRHPFAYRWSRLATRVYELDLPKEFPHIFLRNRHSNNTFFSTVLRHFDDNQRMSLEGDFDKHFTAYTHIATTTPALSLLAPNVIQTLIDTNRKYDIEIAGNKLYLYTNDYYVTANDLRHAFETLDAFMRHVGRRLKSWKFTLPNNKHYPYMTSRAGAGTTAIGHTYYSQAWIGIGAYTAYGLFTIYFNRQWWQAKLTLMIFFEILMVVALLVCRRQYQLRNRNVRR